MVEREPGNDTCQRRFDHVRGVEPPTKTDFEQGNFGRMACEQQECRGGLHFEHRNRRATVFRFAFSERVTELGVVDKPAAVVPAEERSIRFGCSAKSRASTASMGAALALPALTLGRRHGRRRQP